MTKTVDNIAKGHITKITSDYLEVTFNPDYHIFLAPETIVKICVTNSAVGDKIFVGRVYIGSEVKIRLTEILILMDYEKRDFFRINISETVAMYKNPITIEETFSSSQEQFNIKLDNISLSGLFFFSDHVFKEGDKVYIILHLATGKTVFECQIYRVSHDNQDDSIDDEYGYGCDFGKLSSKISDLLYRYIHQKQVEHIKRNKM